jgi:hypothetical protein
MDPDLKARVRVDLESVLKGRAYYHRLGRAWRRATTELREIGEERGGESGGTRVWRGIWRASKNGG